MLSRSTDSITAGVNVGREPYASRGARTVRGEVSGNLPDLYRVRRLTPTPFKTEAGAIFDEGKEEGKEEGRAEERKANAVSMIQNGAEPEFVCKVLKIDKDTLDAWLKEAAESARKNS